MAAVDMVGKEAPAGHNLAGVDVPAGAGLDMVDIPSIVVGMEAADMVCLVEHLHSVMDMACSAWDAHMVVVEALVGEAFVVEELVVEEFVVEGFVVEPEYSGLEYSVLEYSESGCFGLECFELEYSEWEYSECVGLQPVPEFVVHFVQVYFELDYYVPVAHSVGEVRAGFVKDREAVSRFV